MSSIHSSIGTRAEAEISRLPNVEGVFVQLEGEEVREIHVLADATKAPKNVVRDVQTVLLTRLGLQIDRRIVSVVQSAAKPMPAADAGLLDAPGPIPPDTATSFEPRIRFESVNLFVSGARTQAQVELKWKGLPRMGSASGFSTRDESHRLVAAATAAAVQEFLADPIGFGIQAVEFMEVARRRVAVVSLSLLAHRQEKALVGCAVVESDTPQAVALATLAAVNRIVGGLRAKEPTEYIVRPTSS